MCELYCHHGIERSDEDNTETMKKEIIRYCCPTDFCGSLLVIGLWINTGVLEVPCLKGYNQGVNELPFLWSNCRCGSWPHTEVQTSHFIHIWCPYNSSNQRHHQLDNRIIQFARPPEVDNPTCRSEKADGLVGAVGYEIIADAHEV